MEKDQEKRKTPGISACSGHQDTPNYRGSSNVKGSCMVVKCKQTQRLYITWSKILPTTETTEVRRHLTLR